MQIIKIGPLYEGRITDIRLPEGAEILSVSVEALNSGKGLGMVGYLWARTKSSVPLKTRQFYMANGVCNDLPDNFGQCWPVQVSVGDGCTWHIFEVDD